MKRSSGGEAVDAKYSDRQRGKTLIHKAASALYANVPDMRSRCLLGVMATFTDFVRVE